MPSIMEPFVQHAISWIQALIGASGWVLVAVMFIAGTDGPMREEGLIVLLRGEFWIYLLIALFIGAWIATILWTMSPL